MVTIQGTESGQGNSVDQISGDIPVYRPRKKGTMQVRIIPAFDEQGQELPWVDWEKIKGGKTEGLGAQHLNITIVKYFFGGRVNTFSYWSVDAPGAEAIQSPAFYLAQNYLRLFEEAKQIQASNYAVNPLLAPNNWGKPSLSEARITLSQALIFYVDSKPVKGMNGESFRVALVDTPFSALKSIAEKLGTLNTINSIEDEGAATSAADTEFVDYVSSMEGHIINIMASESDTTKYNVVKGRQMPVDPAYMRSVFRPWTVGENAIYKIPTHEEMVKVLTAAVPQDLLGFCMQGTPFEGHFSSRVLDKGREFSIYGPAARSVAPAGPQGHSDIPGALPAFPQPPGMTPPAPRQQAQPPAAGLPPGPPAPGGTSMAYSADGPVTLPARGLPPVPSAPTAGDPPWEEEDNIPFDTPPGAPAAPQAPGIPQPPAPAAPAAPVGPPPPTPKVPTAPGTDVPTHAPASPAVPQFADPANMKPPSAPGAPALPTRPVI